MTDVGLVTAGEMGAAVGAQLVAAGHRVRWEADGRSATSRARAESAGLEPATSLDDAELLVSICPPAVAEQTAERFRAFTGIYLDANAVSPQTVRSMPPARLVDGGIVGGPPSGDDGPRLYLSGADADLVAELFAGTTVAARVLGPEVGTASAMKMAYAAWTKGSAALLLDVARLAERLGVDEALSAEWSESLPDLSQRLAAAERSGATKGWRWVREMEEIADTFAAVGLPDGFHRAAGQVFEGFPREE